MSLPSHGKMCCHNSSDLKWQKKKEYNTESSTEGQRSAKWSFFIAEGKQQSQEEISHVPRTQVTTRKNPHRGTKKENGGFGFRTPPAQEDQCRQVTHVNCSYCCCQPLPHNSALYSFHRAFVLSMLSNLQDFRLGILIFWISTFRMMAFQIVPFGIMNGTGKSKSTKKNTYSAQRAKVQEWWQELFPSCNLPALDCQHPEGRNYVFLVSPAKPVTLK